MGTLFFFYTGPLGGRRSGPRGIRQFSRRTPVIAAAPIAKEIKDSAMLVHTPSLQVRRIVIRIGAFANQRLPRAE